METLYNTVNSAQQYNRKTEQAEQNRAAPSDEFKFAGNRFERSENLLTSKTYHSDELGATITFPDSWVNNVNVRYYGNSIHITDVGEGNDNNYTLYNELMTIGFDVYDNDYPVEFYPPEKSTSGDYYPYSFEFGVSELPAKNKYNVYRCSLNWNKTNMIKTDLDYNNINRDVISILESFRPDGLKYTSLLTQEKKDAVMKITQFYEQSP